MEVKLPSVYRDIYTLTGYRAGVLLRYYCTEMQRAVLPLLPPPVPEPLRAELL